jgi:DNA-binding NarL/FixJ family response regulator
MAVRLLLADDQRLVRAGIAMMLSSEPDVEIVGEAADGLQATDQARRLQPDIVVMDVRMPGRDGIETTRLVTADAFSTDPDRPIKVLVLTTYNVDDTVLAAIRAGASGFLLKDTDPADFLRAIRAIAAGDGWLDPAITKCLLTDFATRPEPATRTPAELRQLTARETEVLVHVAHGLSNSEIAGHLVVSEATVKTHLGRILVKLGLRDRLQAAVTAYQSGLVLPAHRA